jgi:hypothetical protein
VATAVDELTYVSFPIEKWEKNDEGDLLVYGKATDGSVDSDEQIVDPEWSAKALNDWIDTGGNVRVQHQALRDPAGKGLSVEVDRDGDGGHFVRSLVIEPVAKKLVEKGVLTAYSVGIARPVIKRDPSGKARGGIVAGGHLAELSLVDRPANKACGFILGKADKAGALELTGELEADPEFLAKAIAGEELLYKDGSGDAGDGDSQPAPDSDSREDDDNAANAGEPGTRDTVDEDQDVDDDDQDAISKAPGAVRLAYKAARADYLAREPGVKNVAGGTEYLAKRAEWMNWHREGEQEGLLGTREAAEHWLAKRDFSASQRRDAASSGAAMSDGSFPIKNGEDLGNAIHLAGNAKNPSAARSHIRRRAAALGMSDKIPDTWKAEKEDTAAVEEADVEKAGQCPTCKGDGKIMGNSRTCPDCKGTGKMVAKTDSDATVGDVDLPAGSVKTDGDPAVGSDSPSAGTAKADQAGDGDLSEGSAAQPDVVKGSKDCKNCGKSYDADAATQFCGNCGKKLPSARKAAKQERRARREAAIAELAATVLKSVQSGLITAEAGDEIIAEAAAAAIGKKRQLPPDVAQAKPHREPDGTSTVERLEPQAGLPTDPDRTADKVPSSVSALGTSSRPAAQTGANHGGPAQKTGEMPYALGRMHDLTCAAYDPGETLSGFPTLKTVADAVDPGPFLDEAVAAMTAGDVAKASRLGELVEAARAIKAADPAALADASALLHKAFTDMYPNLHITPQSGIRPGSFQRPYLAAGHASETASDSSASIPPSAHTPEPEDFQRPLITQGHQADSPANKAGGPPGEGAMSSTSDFRTTTGAARTYYTNAQRDAARTALQNLHDHIAGSFPDLCPMASSKSVMPADMGANNVPAPKDPPSQGGVPTVGKHVDIPLTTPGVSGPELQQAIADAIRRHSERLPSVGLAAYRPTRKQLQKAASRLGLDLVDQRAASEATTVAAPQPGPAGLSLEEMKALLSDQITPLVTHQQEQLAELRKQLDELGARPDPAMAPVRGQLARTPDVATPVERRSLVDEHAASVNKSAATQEALYRSYVEALTRSPDPGVREAAMATYDKLAGAPAS